MAQFCIKLAGIPMEVSARFDSTKEFCRSYLTQDAPALSVAADQLDLEYIRMQDRASALSEGRRPRRHSEAYLEKLALAYAVLEGLLPYGVLMIHGAVVAVEGKAYLFTAKSGTGKTTHCRLWLKNIPDCHILNGDKPLLLFREDGVFACGSPWRGKERYGVNELLPLAAVCILERDRTNRIETISLQDGLHSLLRQCHIPNGNENVIKVISLIHQLSPIGLYRLGCNMENEAALVSYRAMVKKES